MEVGLFLLALLSAMAFLVTRSGPARGERNVLALAASAACVLALGLHEESENPPLAPGVPAPRTEGGYVGSGACRACHPGEFSSWHDSFHRTMTQLPAPDAVLGDFDDVRLEARGLTYHLTREDDGFWVEMPDPSTDFETHTFGQNTDPSAPLPRRRCRVALMTGSHNQQTYWVSLEHGRGLWIFPWYWIVEAGRWAAREDVFLVPPDDGRMIAVWNHRCIRCHTTGPRPGLDSKTMAVKSDVVELGVACEACHGPGADHAAANRDPLSRYRRHLDGTGDPTIINPARLDPTRSNEVCGQCHYFGQHRDRLGFLTKKDDFDDYLPGEKLSRTREVTRFGPGNNPRGARFWTDGTCRVGGREFNGLIESACCTEGGMSCVSCHSMHRGDPEDQLSSGMDGDRACLQCHEETGADIEEHTHHAPRSDGSRCMNCHMPHSSYALLKAIRSHTIDSPTAEQSTKHGRPNACNLCHLDRTVEWTNEALHRWYGQPLAPTTPTQKSLAAGPLWALEGDAVNRVLAAWSMGWGPARGASGNELAFAPYLLQLLGDPYSTVRYVAQRSLRRLPGFASVTYDYVAPREVRAKSARAARDVWSATLPLLPSPGPSMLFDAGGGLDHEAFRLHLSRRDDTPVGIAE